MLVLTRRPGERIVATTKSGEIINFTVIEVRGNKVRVGLDADESTELHRAEVAARIAAAGLATVAMEKLHDL